MAKKTVTTGNPVTDPLRLLKELSNVRKLAPRDNLKDET